MKKYVVIILIMCMTITSAELQILGDDTDKVINLGTIVESLTNFLGLTDTPSS